MKRLRHLLSLLCCLLPLTGCVGQHEPEDPVPRPVIDPFDGSADIGTRFFHRVLAFDYTATWCQYCPNMEEALGSAKQLRPGRIVEMAVHQYDEMAVPVCDTLVGHFGIAAFPHVVFDFDGSTKIQRQEVALLTDYVDRVIPQPACGLAIDASTPGSVNVRMKAVEAGTYRLAAALVEDGIVARQTGYGDNYVNNAVIVRMLSASYAGDDPGSLQAGEEFARTYTVPAEGENLRVVVYALLRQTDGTWRSSNAGQCALGNHQPYRYEPD